MLQQSPGLVASYDIEPGNGVGVFWDTYTHTHLLTYFHKGRANLELVDKITPLFLQKHDFATFTPQKTNKKVRTQKKFE